MNKKRFSLLLLMFVCLSHWVIPSARAEEIADWPSWRGAEGHGSIKSGSFPVHFGPEKYRWRVTLPGKGTSTPIVLDGKIYLTCPSDGRDAVLAFDAQGKELWKTTFGDELPGKHANGSGSNSSPITDGRAIFAYFKSGTFVAVDLDGKVRWQQDLVKQFGKENMFWDYGTSPVLTEKYVVMVRMHAGDSWIAAFNKSDGQLAWKVDRNYKVPTESDQCYTTPLVFDWDGKESILTWGAEHLNIHTADNGELVWSCGNFNPEANRLWPAIATPVMSQQHLVVAFGRNDRGKPLLYGVKLSGKGDVTATNHSWKRTDVGTFVPSPVVYGKQTIIVGDQGEIEAIDAATGKAAWKNQLPKNRNKVYASPLVAGDRLYIVREDGVVFVGRIQDGQFKLEAENDMHESIIGSPVPFGNSLLLRGKEHLFCVGD
jgi:outer membrane protein assembly factor BamB